MKAKMIRSCGAVAFLLMHLGSLSGYGVIITGDEPNYYPNAPRNDRLLSDAYDRLINSQCVLTNGGTGVLIRSNLVLTSRHIGIDLVNHEKVQFSDGAISSIQSGVGTNGDLAIYMISPSMPTNRV